ENEFHRAAKLLLHGGEHLRSAQEHGRVRVVPAGVHVAVPLRGVGQAGLLLRRERINVRAQGYAFAALSALYLAYEARGLKQAAGYAHFAQLLGYALRRAELLEARLRVHVEVAAHLHDVGEDLVSKCLYVHAQASSIFSAVAHMAATPHSSASSWKVQRASCREWGASPR